MWDESVIVFIQKMFNNLPLIIPLLPDCKLYVCMIFIPIICIYVWSFRIKKWQQAFLITIAPLIAYAIKYIVKPIVARPRPPFELQQVIHPHSFNTQSCDNFYLGIGNLLSVQILQK